jgi:hypothetical protein
MNVWIEPVTILEKEFFFIYDYTADITADDLVVTNSLIEAIQYCQSHQLEYEIVNESNA